MKGRKLFSLLLAGIMTVSTALCVHADTEDEIAYAQQQKQQAESGLAQTQNHIYDLESKKQEMEYYLAELNSQYEELTTIISQLSIDAAQKKEELKKIKLDLAKAKKSSEEQYEAMKIRIAYMYEKGETSTLELLLSSDSFAEFLNRAENIAEISNYDRNMLKKYEELQKTISEQESKARQEAKEIDTLMTERSQKQQEIQTLAETTRDSISAYAYEISASQEEANALMAEISNADSSIAALLVRQQEEEAAAQAAALEAAYEEDEYSEESYTEESYENETYSEDTYTQESYEEEVTEESSSTSTSQETVTESTSSGNGTYLGNFVLTAYCNCAQCCGTAGNLTASGTVPTPGRTVAMAGVPFGTQLLINGNVYTVEDLGTPYGHVDVFFSSHSDALNFGLQNAEVYRLN